MTTFPFSKTACGICFAALLFIPCLLPSFHLTFFAPYLVIAAYRFPVEHALWKAMGCGLVIDLFSSSYPFGFHALQYCLSLGAIRVFTRFLFEDKLSTLPIMSMLFAQVSTLLHPCLCFLVRHPFSLAPQWIASDIFLMSFLEFFYALFFFTLPFQGIKKIMKKRRELS